MDRRSMIGTLAAGTIGLGLAGNADLAQDAPAREPLADYKPRAFAFGEGLPGLSKELLAEHLTLYQGYVKRTNGLLKDIQAIDAGAVATAAAQETRRRLGFEFSGMRLHELYFETLRAKAAGPSPAHPLQQAIKASWGSFDAWWAAFKATCTLPGVGWGALVQDPVTSRVFNAWFQDHENAIPVGAVPLLVVDVWEHAYVKDYGATARGKYVDAIRPLIDWSLVEKRFN